MKVKEVKSSQCLINQAIKHYAMKTYGVLEA
jgi:hypothetical protein